MNCCNFGKENPPAFIGLTGIREDGVSTSQRYRLGCKWRKQNQSIQKPRRLQPRSQTWQHSEWEYVTILEANRTSLSGVTDPIFVLQRIGANVEDALLS